MGTDRALIMDHRVLTVIPLASRSRPCMYIYIHVYMYNCMMYNVNTTRPPRGIEMNVCTCQTDDSTL